MSQSSLRPVVVGSGRLGTVMARALADAGYAVPAPLGRGADPQDADVILLCVPDDQIAAAAAALTPRDGLVVGHVSGASDLTTLAPHVARFSLHPLMTFTGTEPHLRGIPAAVSASDAETLALAHRLAESLGLSVIDVAEADRAAYHAGTCMASNHLVALEWAATRVAGLPREALVPIVRATVENWARLGPEKALTGPASRGDTATIERHRAALAGSHPEMLELYDVLHRLTCDLTAARDRAGATDPEDPS